MFFCIVLTPISTTSGLWSIGKTLKYQKIDIYIYQRGVEGVFVQTECKYWSVLNESGRSVWTLTQGNDYACISLSADFFFLQNHYLQKILSRILSVSNVEAHRYYYGGPDLDPINSRRYFYAITCSWCCQAVFSPDLARFKGKVTF